MTNDITKTQTYKILELLNTHKQLTGPQIAKMTGFPIQSIRNVLVKMHKVNVIEKAFIYRLK